MTKEPKKDAKAVKALIAKHEAQRNKGRSGNFVPSVVIPPASLFSRLRRRQK